MMAVSPLSGREAEVWQLHRRGSTDQQIAVRLGLRVTTVRVHLHKARKKLIEAHNTLVREQQAASARAALAALIRALQQERGGDPESLLLGYCSEILEAVRNHDGHPDHGPLIGRTWTDSGGTTLAEEIQVAATRGVTPHELLDALLARADLDKLDPEMAI